MLLKVQATAAAADNFRSLLATAGYIRWLAVFLFGIELAGISC